MPSFRYQPKWQTRDINRLDDDNDENDKNADDDKYADDDNDEYVDSRSDLKRQWRLIVAEWGEGCTRLAENFHGILHFENKWKFINM